MPALNCTYVRILKGGPGSGRYPKGSGGITGSPEAVKAVSAQLAGVPRIVWNELGQKPTIDVASSKAAAAAKIEAYLLKHYGITEVPPMKGLADLDRSHILTFAVPVKPSSDDTGENDALAQLSHLFPHRYEGDEWKATSRGTHESFTASFLQVFGTHQMDEVLSMTNPITAVLERGPVVDLFRKWGWL